MTKKWIVDKDDGLRLFYGDENFNGSAYPCNDIVFMKMIADKLNKLEKENEQLKSDNKCYVKRYSELFEDYIACKKENEQLKKQIERIDFILDDLNGAEYISRDDGIKALNKIDKVIGKR